MAKKGFFGEFKEFISRGNVIDMAVGVVVGSAFTAIVNSLVKDVVTPAIGLITGGVDFSSQMVVLATDPETGEVLNAIKYGALIQNIINFLLIALVVFCFVKAINKLREKAAEAKKAEEEAKAAEAAAAAPAEPEKPSEVLLLEEIRDLLKK
ncbi:MAG: large conductance mechanosensitive channel protein MscL [Clostridia bacterium]|nr:large conductance mechanosensitive channel protein MscL [Clostridia bacterium]